MVNLHNSAAGREVGDDILIIHFLNMQVFNINLVNAKHLYNMWQYDLVHRP